MKTLYRGSVKDLVGPVAVGENAGVIFEYSDSYSVFDWGRMPDLLTGKGDALAVLAAVIFEKLESPETWKEFSRTPEALALRKGNRFGAIFNELGEELQAKGLRTHYLGVINQAPTSPNVEPKKTSQVQSPFKRLVVKQVSVTKPALTSILGRTLPDYTPTRMAPAPRLLPLEVIFRMGCPEGSSLIERASKDSGYLASLGYPDLQIKAGARWDFPLLETFTKLETTDRLIPLSEALAISGVPASVLQDVLLKTIWVAGLLKYWFNKLNLEMADGKLEWAVSSDGSCFLVDAIGPDELRILSRDGMQLSKEFLRIYYRKTPWYELLEKAKAHARNQGSVEWKRSIQENPPALPAHYKELAIQVYASLTNAVSERKWFPDAWSLDRVVEQLRVLRAEQNARGDEP